AADAAAGAGAVPAGGTPSGTTAGTPGCGGGAWLCGSVRWRQAFSGLRYPLRPQEEGAAAAADATAAAAAGSAALQQVSHHGHQGLAQFAVVRFAEMDAVHPAGGGDRTGIEETHRVEVSHRLVQLRDRKSTRLN